MCSWEEEEEEEALRARGPGTIARAIARDNSKGNIIDICIMLYLIHEYTFYASIPYTFW